MAHGHLIAHIGLVGAVPEASWLWQYERAYGRAADPWEPVLAHVWEDDHGACSTLGHMLYHVSHHHGWGRQKANAAVSLPGHHGSG